MSQVQHGLACGHSWLGDIGTPCPYCTNGLAGWQMTHPPRQWPQHQPPQPLIRPEIEEKLDRIIKLLESIARRVR